MRKITLVGLLFSASCAQASDWVQLGNSDNLEVFLDKGSIARSGKLRKAWIAYSSNDSQIIYGKNYKSTKSLQLFSCAERTYGSYQIAYYADAYGQGLVVHTWQIQPKTVVLSDVVPDSLGESTLNAVCRVSLPSA